MWADLKAKIAAILQANNLIQNVFDFEVSEFGGDPAAVVIPSANESDYRTTTQNRRIYAFTIQLWVKRTDPRTDKNAEDTLTDLVDSVLDDFDRFYTLGTGSPGNPLTIPVGYTMIMVRAMPSQWFYAERETTYRGAEIIVKVQMDVDVTAIS